MSNRKKIDWGQRMEDLRQSYGGKCKKCGAANSGYYSTGCVRHLEFAHIKITPLSGAGRGRGIKARWRDIRKHPDCYILLCKNCHNDLDVGLIYYDEITETFGRVINEEVEF